MRFSGIPRVCGCVVCSQRRVQSMVSQSAVCHGAGIRLLLPIAMSGKTALVGPYSDSASTTAGSATQAVIRDPASMAVRNGAIWTIDYILHMSAAATSSKGLDRQLCAWYSEIAAETQNPPSHNPEDCDKVLGRPSTGACWQWSRAFVVGLSRALRRAASSGGIRGAGRSSLLS